MKKGPVRVGRRGRPLRGANRPLSRARIVAAALRIVDRDGLEALSMRKLGASLGVDPMAIYYHVPNKGALYDALVEAVMADMDLGADLWGASPFERLKHAARAYRNALLAHPNALSVVASRPVRTVAALRPIEIMIGMLLDYGLPLTTAYAAVDICGHYILGSVQSYVPHITNARLHEHDEFPLESLPPDEFPNIRRAVAESPAGHPFEREFELGLDALLKGILTAQAGS